MAATNNKCFNDLIGLRNSCEAIPSANNIYINDLGISLNELNEFVGEDFTDGESLFKSQKNLAINYVVQNVNTYFSSRFKTFSLIENKRVGYYSENKPLISGLNEYKGMRIQLDNKGSYISFCLEELSLFVNNTTSINIEVFDLTSGELIDSFVFYAEANKINTIYPKNVYNSNKSKLDLFIGYNTNGISYYESSATQSAGCASCNSKPNHNNEFVNISCSKVAIGDAKIPNNIKSSNDCGGLSIIYSLKCNHENWLCNISNMIALPIAYKTAAFIMEYGIYITPNEMLTNRSTINRDLLKERLTMYEQKFEESMKNVLNNIELPSDDRCFVCKQPSRTTIMLP